MCRLCKLTSNYHRIMTHFHCELHAREVKLRAPCEVSFQSQLSEWNVCQQISVHKDRQVQRAQMSNPQSYCEIVVNMGQPSGAIHPSPPLSFAWSFGARCGRSQRSDEREVYPNHGGLINQAISEAATPSRGRNPGAITVCCDGLTTICTGDERKKRRTTLRAALLVAGFFGLFPRWKTERQPEFAV